MSTRQTAYVTGAASGLGKATAEMLVKKGIKVFAADVNVSALQGVCAELSKLAPGTSHQVQYCAVDISDWESQAKAFTQAVSALDGRVDHVYAIAGISERRWLPKDSTIDDGFEKPDLGTLDVDLTGTLYTVSLAIQQFRRQAPDENGKQGQIGVLVSVLGFYCVPTIPIYTAAKHGLAGFIRSYGKYLKAENITLNGVCPNIVKTNMSIPEFYKKLEKRELLTPLNAVPDTFAALLDGELKDSSGELYEVGPNYGKNGERWIRKPWPDVLDSKTDESLDMLEERARPLQIHR